jgi:hypothetical protein
MRVIRPLLLQFSLKLFSDGLNHPVDAARKLREVPIKVECPDRIGPHPKPDNPKRD